MLASARELGVFDDHSGILVLPPDTPVGVDVVEAVDLRDTVLDVKTAPNRGDILSMRGIAREMGTGLRVDAAPVDVGRIAAEGAIVLTDLRSADGGLEDLFLELTSDTQRDDVPQGAPA